MKKIVFSIGISVFLLLTIAIIQNVAKLPLGPIGKMVVLTIFIAILSILSVVVITTLKSSK